MILSPPIMSDISSLSENGTYNIRSGFPWIDET